MTRDCKEREEETRLLSWAQLLLLCARVILWYPATVLRTEAKDRNRRRLHIGFHIHKLLRYQEVRYEVQ